MASSGSQDIPEEDQGIVEIVLPGALPKPEHTSKFIIDQLFWKDTVLQTLGPVLGPKLLRSGFWQPNLLWSMVDVLHDGSLDFGEAELFLDSLKVDALTEGQRLDWKTLLLLSQGFAQAATCRTINGLSGGGIFSGRALSIPADSKVGLPQIDFLDKLKGKMMTAPKKRKIDEATELKKWRGVILRIVLDAKLPIHLQLAHSLNRDALERVVCQGRLGTLSKHGRAATKAVDWLLGTYKIRWFNRPVQLMDYLVELAEGICAPSVLGTTVGAVDYVEGVGGVGISDRTSRHPTVLSVQRTLYIDLKSARPVALKRKGMPLFVVMVISLELRVMDAGRPQFQRVSAWTRLLRLWIVLRWADTRFMPPYLARFCLGILTVVLTQTKTTGLGKKIETMEGWVSSDAFIAKPEWLATGWRLFQELSWGSRSHWLPYPTKDLQAFSDQGVEPTYADALSMGRALMTSLDAVERVPGSEKFQTI